MSVRRSRRRSAGDQPESIILEDRAIIDTGNLSPTSTLERDPRSPKSWKRRDSDGVGLGILAALDRTSIGDSPARLIVGNSGRLTVKSDIIGCSSKRCSSEEMGVDCTSPSPRFTGGVSDFREADFLSYCYLCRKRLHGRDIYMYRGEKAFCSMECRYQQIVSDECHEKCASEIVSTSPYFCDGRLFFAGITAA